MIKKLILTLVALIIFLTFPFFQTRIAFADTLNFQKPTAIKHSSNKHHKLGPKCIKKLAYLLLYYPLLQNYSASLNTEPMRSGCCSWHQGVCGCDDDTDRIVCCDETYSPTCRCSDY